ncbi:MAG TPA: class I SAM-dependent methyltransferase [Anaerolineales bacterium]|nr:class I SAM-dependent methyltransferase [Anaerolineales bacterium]
MVILRMNILRRLFFNFWYYERPPWDTGISPPELIAFIASQPPGRALDLGCGTGTNVITLARNGWQATGVDFAWRAIQIAKRKAKMAGVQARFRVEDVTRLQDLTGPYDLVLDMGCFHGLGASGQNAYLQYLERLLAPGGTYLMYGFFKDRADASLGMDPSDLEKLSARQELVTRQDGVDRNGRHSVWLTYRKPV